MNIKRLYVLSVILCALVILPMAIWVYWPIVRGKHDFNEARAKQEIASIQPSSSLVPASTGIQSDTNNVRFVYHADVLQDQSRLVNEYTNSNPGFEFFGLLKTDREQSLLGVIHVYVRK